MGNEVIAQIWGVSPGQLMANPTAHKWAMTSLAIAGPRYMGQTWAIRDWQLIGNDVIGNS
jgi:hypothetical protein